MVILALDAKLFDKKIIFVNFIVNDETLKISNEPKYTKLILIEYLHSFGSDIIVLSQNTAWPRTFHDYTNLSKYSNIIGLRVD